MDSDAAPIEPMNVPFPRAWWIRRPVLLAGCYPGDLDASVARRKLQALLDAGIRTVISLQPIDETSADGKPFAAYEPLLKQLASADSMLSYCVRLPIPDCGVPSPTEMATILNVIDGSIDTGHPVYVHCWGGHGRTGTVVGCWLVRTGRSGEAALAEIHSLRSHDAYLCEQPAPQTEAQRQLVRDWAALDTAAVRRSPSQSEES
jgi:hypothetical protein